MHTSPLPVDKRLYPVDSLTRQSTLHTYAYIPTGDSPVLSTPMNRTTQPLTRVLHTIHMRYDDYYLSLYPQQEHLHHLPRVLLARVKFRTDAAVS